MTPVKLKYYARNALVFLRDSENNSIPEITREGPVWTITTCLAASGYPDSEGPTSIIIASGDDPPKTDHLVFDGTIDFPSGFAAIDTVLDDVILEFPVAKGKHRVRVWNDGNQASEVLVFGID